jgi:methyl-accepting chemotaxis protein
MSQVNLEVFGNVTAMSAAVAESIAATHQMTEAIQKTGDYVKQLNTDIESVNSSMNRLDSSIALEEKSAKDSIELSKELSINSDNGLHALRETIKGIGKIKKSSHETARVITTLGEHAMNIGNILHVIEDVTKQTNLLALNAAIISAQAGEHGRGFAVVANEIGALAGRTKDSTKEIADLINAIQDEAQKAVAAMEESNLTIEQGAHVGVQAAKAFDKLRESADKSAVLAKSLSAATTEQAGDVKAVTEAIKTITSMVGEINRASISQAKEAEALNESTGKMHLLNEQVARSSEEQAKSAQDVLKAIKNISEVANLVSSSQKAQTESTKLAVVTVNDVDNYVKSQNDSAHDLTAAINEINQQIGKLSQYTGEFKI